MAEDAAEPERQVQSSEKLREGIRAIGGRLVDEHRKALRILRDHDPDAPASRCHS
jgi:hypothetical protein